MLINRFWFLLALILLYQQGLLNGLQCTCRSSWTLSNSQCYKFYNQSTSRSNAEQICGGSNAHLVSIHSASENNIVTSIARISNPQLLTITGYNIWIGYTNSMWSDGTSINYTNWAAFQPGTSSCAILKACWAKPTLINLCAMSLLVHEGKWYGASCSQGNVLGFVCKKRCSDYEDLITGKNGFTEDSFDAIKQQIIALNGKTQTQLATDVQNRKKPIPSPVVRQYQNLTDKTDICKQNKAAGLDTILHDCDLLLPADRLAELHGADIHGRKKRQAITNQTRRWYNNTIPFYFHPSVSDGLKATFRLAVNFYLDHTCVQWAENMNATPRVRVFNGTGCYSAMGMQYEYEEQDLSLNDPNCNNLATILHEMAHTMGFWHTQSRYDRDSYIYVNASNIQTGHTHDYDRYTDEEAITYALPYDFGSNMHYKPGTYALSSDIPVMLANDPLYQETMGSKLGPSFIDIQNVNNHYGCIDMCIPPRPLCVNDGYVNIKNCSKCVCPDGFVGDLCDQTDVGQGGNVIQVTNTVWQTLAQNVTPSLPRSGWLSAFWHFQTPVGYAVQIQIIEAGDQCTPGCYAGGVEFKMGNFGRTGSRLCCPEQSAGQPILYSVDNWAIIRIYAWQNSVHFNINYRYGEPQTATTSQFPITTPAPVLYNCEDGWVLNDDAFKCYKIFTESISNTEAEHRCQRNGGNLVSIHDQNNNDFITNLTKQTLNDTSKSLLVNIGLAQRNNVGFWSWVDYTITNFLNWQSSMPDNTKAYGYLVANLGTDTYGTSHSNFVAGQWATKDDAPINGVVTYSVCHKQPSTCNQGWVYNENTGTCYKLTDQPANLGDSQSQCQQLGGELVSIHSDAENDFIIGIADVATSSCFDSTCIGIYIGITGNVSYLWTDGTPVSYSNYNSNGPNGSASAVILTAVSDIDCDCSDSTSSTNSVLAVMDAQWAQGQVCCSVPPAEALCQSCKSTVGLWNSTTANPPTPNNVANIVHQLAFHLNSAGTCGQPCVCSLNGHCYTPINSSAWHDLLVIPYCDAGICHMYAADWQGYFDSGSRWQDENGNLLPIADVSSVPVGVFSPYETLKGFGCNGCASLIGTINTCQPPNPSCPTGTSTIFSLSNTIIANKYPLGQPIADFPCSNGDIYCYLPDDDNGTIRQNVDQTYVACDACICDINGVCWRSNDINATFYKLESYCPIPNTCYMYVVQEGYNGYFPPPSTGLVSTNGSLFKQHNAQLKDYGAGYLEYANIPDYDYIKVASIVCGACPNQTPRSCVDTTPTTTPIPPTSNCTEGKWDVISNDQILQAVCEIKPTKISLDAQCDSSGSICPKGWIYMPETRKCYALGSYFYDLSYAQQYCAVNEGYLAHITSETLNKALTDFINGQLPYDDFTQSVYVGLVDTNHNGVYSWVDDKYIQVIPLNYTNWQPGQPNSGASVAALVVKVSQADIASKNWSVGGWATNDPSISNMFLCERKACTEAADWAELFELAYMLIDLVIKLQSSDRTAPNKYGIFELFEGAGFKGNNLLLYHKIDAKEEDIYSCTSLVDSDWGGKATSIRIDYYDLDHPSNTNGHCVILFENKDCTGSHIIVTYDIDDFHNYAIPEKGYTKFYAYSVRYCDRPHYEAGKYNYYATERLHDCAQVEFKGLCSEEWDIVRKCYHTCGAKYYWTKLACFCKDNSTDQYCAGGNCWCGHSVNYGCKFQYYFGGGWNCDYEESGGFSLGEYYGKCSVGSQYDQSDCQFTCVPQYYYS